MDARFDVPRLLRGALLTINRDAGESVVKKALDELPEIPRLFGLPCAQVAMSPTPTGARYEIVVPERE